MKFIQGMNTVGNLSMSWQMSALFIALTVVVVVGSPTMDLMKSVDCLDRR